MKLVSRFADIGKEDTATAGGKGASLGEMTQAGIPVPEGFVVLVSAFERFLEETDLLAEIDSILHTVNKEEMHTVEHASEKIQQLILGARMPTDIAAEVQKEFEQLGASYVAVRSSATAEDSASAAWAGQLDSYLNTSAETLLTNVQRCWASLFTPRAIFYRFEKGLHSQKISVAVVVQKMVASEVSGIAFSVHPITEDRNQLIIEAGYGLGEAIVSGQITPDSYVVEKEPRRVIDTNVNTQKKALHRASGGGNEWQDIPEPQASSQVLMSEQVLELAELVIRIEKHYDFACDIEWAFEDSKFYIVQSRPITTLGDDVADKPSKEVFEKVFARDFCMVGLEIPMLCEGAKSKPWQDEPNPFSPYLLIERSDGTAHIYYNENGVNWTIEVLKKKVQADPTFLAEVEDKVRAGITYIQPRYESEETLSRDDLIRFIDEFIAAYNWIEAMWWIKSMSEEDLGVDHSRIVALREETEKLSAGTEIVIRKSLEHLYPELGSLASMVRMNELRANQLPSKDELQKRQDGFVLVGENLILGATINTVAEELGLTVKEDGAEVQGDTIQGQTAYGGKIQGTVCRVMGHTHFDKMQEGMVLLSPMTMVDFLPLMKMASAIITDEGGITSHAAIVARELKKPCVIGTKIATKVLRDGDIVEVDADSGTVKILKSANPFGSIDEWQRLFRVQGLRFLIDDLWMEHYKTLGALTVIINDEYTSYLPHKMIEQTLADGVDLISNAEKFEQYEKEFRAYMAELQTYAASLDFEKASKDEIAHLLKEVARLFSYYSKTEFFSTDGAYKLFEETKDTGLEKRLELMGQIKNDGRSFLNSTFFGSDAVLPKLLNAFEQRFGVPERTLQQYSRDELLALFDGEQVSNDEIERRNDAFYIVSVDGKQLIKTGVEAKRDIQAFIGEATREHSETIEGTSAHTGMARGTARIIRAGYDNFDTLHQLMDAMQKGDILVAETTSPELMPACQKAGGIITDQGGMLSHAAIVSRELNIPCIVGTSNATEAIIDGDIVEVDGNKGVVHIIERAQRG